MNPGAGAPVGPAGLPLVGGAKRDPRVSLRDAGL